MSDIKSVLSLLCQHLNLSINVTMKPEYFRSVKFGDTTNSVTKIFWKILNILSYHAVKDKAVGIDFQQFDTVWATKLYFAYLQYTAIEFYALDEGSRNNRQLLLALAWLLGTQNVLSIVVQINVANSVLGRECSQYNNAEEKKVDYDQPETLIAQVNNILYLNGKVNYNIKEISELISERTKLITKAHAASINISGLPHLSVSELSLIKRIATINKDAPTDEDKKYLRELHTINNLLDTHMKWLKKEYIFFEWMVTVIEEHNKSLSSSLNDVNWNEVSKFISLLRYIIQEKLETPPSKQESIVPQCISRLLRSPNNTVQMESWLAEISKELDKETKHLSERKEKLSKELKKILRLIPSCVQV
ncbi:uncharacterized protein LOC143187154 [Calliopsis andreniformis]|uniref:uncharacterized protein LOC143187154 n=1 Tax=Calliopsis andreniformis TaxID=337506 RepID=UPI003FCCE313